MTIVFAKTRHEYGSYQDLWTLASLAGFQIGTIDDVDPDSDNVYIVSPMNGEIEELRPQWRKPGDRKATIIWWFLERLDSTPMLTDGSYDRHRVYFDRVWVSDRWMAAQHPTLQHMILGSHPDFGKPRGEIQYDYTHQSYVHGRRIPIYTKLRRMGLREGPNGWGDARDTVLRTSATMVHVQQFHLPLYTPLRFALAAAYRLPLVCEKLHDSHPLDNTNLIQVPLDQLPEKVCDAARSKTDIGDRLYDALCIRHPFGQEVENAL